MWQDAHCQFVKETLLKEPEFEPKTSFWGGWSRKRNQRKTSKRMVLRYIKDWVIWGTFKNEGGGGWSISVSMQPIGTKLSKKMTLVTKAHFDKQLSQ